MYIVDSVSGYTFKGESDRGNIFNGRFTIEWDDDIAYPILDYIEIDGAETIIAEQSQHEIQEQINEMGNHLLWAENRQANMADEMYDWFKQKRGH